MKLREWKRKFTPRVLQRGENYCLNDAVRSMKWDGRRLSATVAGTETYHVKIAVSGGAVGEMSCTCPYEYEGYCKHIAAVLFAASGDDFPGEDGDYEKASGISIEEAVRSLSASDAKILLARCAAESPDIADWVLLKATGGVSGRRTRQWMKQISGLAREYSDRYGFIDYGNASAYANEVDALMNEKVSLLLDAGQAVDAFALTCKVCEEIARVDIDDSNGEIMWLYRECADRWRDILPGMSPEERRRAFDWIQSHYGLWDAADEPFDEFLFGASGECAALREPEFLQRKLQLLDEQIAKSSSEYRLGRFVLYRLDVMRQLSVGREETERFVQKHYRLSDVRRLLVEEAVQEGRVDDAIGLLRQSKEMDAAYPVCVGEYSEKLIALFRTLNRTEELREELLYQMENVKQDNLNYVDLLKDLTPPEDWPALRERLLSMRGLSYVYRKLMEREGLYRRLLDDALQSGTLRVMEAFFDTLSREYPDETREFYVSCLRSDMEHASNRNEYAEHVRRLKQLRTVRGGTEAAAALADEWRKAYPRRRAMLDELKKSGF